jgi:hypothetical protein
MSKPVPSSGMLSLYSGRRFLGTIISRSKSGHEAFDAEGTSLGLYPNQKAAMDAVARAAVPEAEAAS